jgi:hypothetical protein
MHEARVIIYPSADHADLASVAVLGAWRLALIALLLFMLLEFVVASFPCLEPSHVCFRAHDSIACPIYELLLRKVLAMVAVSYL